MIDWTIDHYTTTSGTGQDAETTHHGSGDLCVWFHDSDHTTSGPDRRVSASDVGPIDRHPDGHVTPPAALLRRAVKPAVLDSANQNKPMTTRKVQIFLEAFVGETRYHPPRETALY